MICLLHPGDWTIQTDGHIKTTVGSCVAVLLWHPPTHTMAAAHIMLPQRVSLRGHRINAPHNALDAKFATEALDLMCDALRQAGIAPEECQGHLYGGGNMFPSQYRSRENTIGFKNASQVQRLLHKHGVPILHQDVAGTGHRELTMDVTTGLVMNKHVPLD